MKCVRRFTVLVLLASLLASGCWDRIELEDIAWVQALGFDAGPPGFLTTTMEIGVPRSLSGGGTAPSGGAAGPRYTTITIVSRTALEAFDLAALNLGRHISLVHTQVFVFGEELAKADLRSLAGAMDRFREIRGMALVTVAQGRAEDILRVNMSPLEVSPSRFIQTVTQQHPYTGLFEVDVFVRDFLDPMESSSVSPRCPIIALASDYKTPQSTGQGAGQGATGASDPAQQMPSSPKVGERVEPKVNLEELPPEKNVTDLGGWQVPKAGGGPVIVMGMALLQGGKMVGTLTGDEARTVLLVRNDLERATVTVPDPTARDKPELSLGAEINAAKTDVHVDRTGTDVRVKVDAKVEVSYISPKTQTDYSDPRMTPLAESAIADYLKASLDRTVAKTQALGVDPFGFGGKVKRTFLTWPAFEEFAWMTKYPTAKVETNVQVHIKRYGLDLQPLVVPPSEIIQKQQ